MSPFKTASALLLAIAIVLFLFAAFTSQPRKMDVLAGGLAFQALALLLAGLG